MSTIKPLALLLSRVLLGVILIAHGWDKFQITGLEGVSGFFASLGIPAAGVVAPLVGAIELIGGIMIILGVFTRYVSAGIYVTNGGWELVGAIGAGMLALIAVGAGAWSVDAVLEQQKTTERELVNA